MTFCLCLYRGIADRERKEIHLICGIVSSGQSTLLKLKLSSWYQSRQLVVWQFTGLGRLSVFNYERSIFQSSLSVRMEKQKICNRWLKNLTLSFTNQPKHSGGKKTHKCLFLTLSVMLCISFYNMVDIKVGDI